MKKYLVVAFVLATLAMGGVQAQIAWNFGNATDGALGTPSTDVEALLSAGAVTQGNNNGTTTLLTTTSASSGYAGATGSFNAGAAARIGALDLGMSAYFEFTLTADGGSDAEVSALSFGSRSTSTGPKLYTIVYSTDSFANSTTLASGSMPSTSTWALYSPTFTALTITSGTSVAFRIYGSDGTGSPTAGTANWRVDDLTVNPVPEPGTVALIALGLGVVVLGMRRRHVAA
jgi:hypothetical protein